MTPGIPTARRHRLDLLENERVVRRIDRGREQSPAGQQQRTEEESGKFHL